MKKKTGKRWLAALLAVIMTVGVLPVSALADEPETDESSSVVTAREASAETTGAKLVKTAKYDPNTGKYTITLESWVTGEVKPDSVKPMDIVLLLDVSGSMTDTIENYTYTATESRGWSCEDIENGSYYYLADDGKYYPVGWRGYGVFDYRCYLYYGSWPNRIQLGDEVSSYTAAAWTGVLYTRTGSGSVTMLAAMQTAVNNFIDTVAAKSPTSRISIVKFSGNETDRIGNDTYQSTGYTYNYTQIVKALTTVDTAGVTALKDAVSGLKAAGATASDYGMSKVTKALEQATPGNGKIVIMFTDGEPNHSSGFETNVANDAISRANALEADGAKVFTIGMFDGARPKNADGTDNVSDNFNKYMHGVSSNYPNATSIDRLGTRSEGNYYHAATNAAGLEAIFETIAGEIEPNVPATTETAVSDTLSDYFHFANLDDNGKLTGYTVKTVDYKGKDANNNDVWDTEMKDVTGVTVSVDGKTVTATGFNYADNAVAVKEDGQPTGKKLVVTFEITPDAGFTGWDYGEKYYVTNESAVMGKDNQVFATVASPTAPVTAYKVTYGYDDTAPGNAPTIEDKTNYIKGQTVTVKYPNGTFDWEGYTYTFDGWTSDDVTISSGTFTMPDKNVTLTGSWSSTVNSHTVHYQYTGTIPTGAPNAPADESHNYNDTVTVDTTVTTFDGEDGYTYEFSGWSTSDATIGEDGTFTMPDKNVTLTGSWSKTAKAANYKVEYYLQNLAGDGYDLDTDPTRTREVASTTDASVSEAPAAIEGFTFDENNTNNVLSGTVAANGSTVLKLYYTRNSYKVTYEYTGDVPTGASELPAEKEYKYGAEVTVEPKATAPNYTFHGWYKGSDEVTSFTMPAENVELTGYWTKDDVIADGTVTFEVVNGTWVGLTSTIKTVTVTLTNGVGHLADGDIPTPTPNAGYSNGRWDVEPTTTMDVHDGDKFIYTYTKLPTIILGGDGNGHLNIKKSLATTGYVESIAEAFNVTVTGYGYAEQPTDWSDLTRPSGDASKSFGSVTMTAAGTASFRNWTANSNATDDFPCTLYLSTLTFTKAGVYIFKVQEAEGRTAGMHYDSSEYGLAVVVKADDNGDLYIAMYTALANLYNSTINDFIKNYSKDTYTVNHEITINNTYNGDPDTFPVKLGDFVKKTYTSTYGWSSTADFTFTATINEEAISNSLTAGEAPKPATDLSKPITGTVRITTGQTLDVNFGTIYLEEGRYFVEVSEVKGNATDVKYDDTVYHFTIVIKPDNEGKPVIEYHNLMSRTPEGKFIELERGAKAEFKNEYTYYYFNPNPPTPPTPELNTEDHVAYLIGFTDGTIRPEANITRGEVATIFFRLLTDEARTQYWSQTNSYSDVPADLWCNNAISTLSNMGIINGYLDGTFRPSAPITRSELTKIAVSFFKYADINKFAYDGRFPDVKGDEWYVRYLAASVEFGLIEGDGNGMFRPNDPITRAETCTIVNRTLGRKPDAAHLLGYGVMITWPDNSNINAWYYAAMQEATNSHDYTWITVNQAQVENWTAKLTERDWAALERMWSNANSAPGGEVMG